MQTSGFWLKLGREFSPPYPKFLRVFKIRFFLIKTMFSSA